MEIKKFIKDHKKEFIVTGVVVAGVTLTVIALKKAKTPTKELQKICEKIAALPPRDLTIPDWNGMEIFEHWTEDHVQNMILKCHVTQLGELGEHLLDDFATQCNPDIPVELVLTYCNSAVV